MNIIDYIIEHEDFSHTPYMDSKGVWTIAHGLSEYTELIDIEKNLLGVDNIKDLTYIDEKTSIWIVSRLICDIWNKLDKYDWYEYLDDNRKMAITDLVYNIGWSKFIGFSKTIGYLKNQDFEKAGVELLDSSYFQDTKGRAIRNSILISTGEIISIENARWLYKILKKRM